VRIESAALMLLALSWFRYVFTELKPAKAGKTEPDTGKNNFAICVVKSASED
jgi:hypothetical protein